MFAVRIHENGGPDVLRYEEVSLPEPAGGEVRLKIMAAGINFVDTYHRKGLYKLNLPTVLGREGAGFVDALGEGVTHLKEGDRVAFANDPYSYSEYAVIPAARVVRVPEGMSFEDAAAVLLQGMTAHYLALTTYPLKQGDTALIHAAAGGAGQLLVQIAKLCGARVIGTVSTEAKAELARTLGADDVILYSQMNFEPEVKRIMGGKGVEVVYDSVGKDTYAQSMNCLKPRGMLVLWGNASGAVPPIDPLTLMSKGSLFMTRPTLGHYIADRAELEWRAGDVFNWVKDGKVHVRIDRTFPLRQAAEAHRYIESRASMGKVLLIP